MSFIQGKRRHHARRWVFAVAAVALIVMFSGVATAADNTSTSRDYDSRFYITPMASLGFFGRARGEVCTLYDGGCLDSTTQHIHPDADVGPEIKFGKRIFEYLALEADAFYFDGDVQDGGDFNRYGFSANALIYPFGAELPLYGIVGYGFGKHDYDNLPSVGASSYASGPLFDEDSEDSEFLDLGAGFLLPVPNYDASLRFEYRHRASDVDTQQGGEITFRDNIVSIGLQIPLGAKPEPASEPAPEPVKRPPPPKPEPKPIVLRGANFNFDKATLRPKARDILDGVITELDEHSAVRVRIAGHTDSKGSDAYNQRLSLARAQSVADYLTGHGIAQSRIVSVKGYGERRPVAPNTKQDGSDNPAGRAKNRRVEIHKVQ